MKANKSKAFKIAEWVAAILIIAIIFAIAYPEYLKYQKNRKVENSEKITQPAPRNGNT